MGIKYNMWFVFPLIEWKRKQSYHQSINPAYIKVPSSQKDDWYFYILYKLTIVEGFAVYKHTSQSETNLEEAAETLTGWDGIPLVGRNY